jgi:Secretion system C-terminal sorting domain
MGLILAPHFAPLILREFYSLHLRLIQKKHYIAIQMPPFGVSGFEIRLWVPQRLVDNSIIAENFDAANIKIHGTGPVTVSITDNIGREVYSNTHTPNGKSIMVNPGNLASGIYMVQVSSEQGVGRQKLVRE